MNTQVKSLFGIYPSWQDAEDAVSKLQAVGFSNADISILVQAENLEKDALSPERHTQAPKGLAYGAASGAVVGGALGLAAGLGALMIPGIGPLLAAGPLWSVLAGMSMGGAAGGVAGAFVGVGFPENKAADLEENLQMGNVLVSVHADDPAKRLIALRVFEETDADSITHSHEDAISSVDDLRPTFATPPLSAKEDFISRKQF